MENEFFGKLSFNGKVTKQALYVIIFLFSLSSCSVTKKIDKQAKQLLLQDTVIGTGHLGISIFDPAENSYWYNYNAEKYFTPASNTKLFTLYAGMKYLGDSLVGLKYTDSNTFNCDTLIYNYNGTKVFPTGDPTFLNPEFPTQPVFDFLKKQEHIEICDFHDIQPMGKGWAWDDYLETYMTNRSSFPIYSNVIKIKFIKKDSVIIEPKYYSKHVFLSYTSDSGFSVFRDFGSNKIALSSGYEKTKEIPFYPGNYGALLEDTLHQKYIMHSSWLPTEEDLKRKYKVIHSQPSDSLFKPMMHYSDNFFAEQTLLMVSNEKLGVMNDEKIIDTLLKSDLKDIPQVPQWVDGSGLSRYNLFTPKDFVYLLNKMKNEFGLERMKVILPTGGEGTIKNYYKEDSGFIYVKTGTLSNQVALSGYLITQKNKLLVFSLLANNVNGSASDVRRAFERFLKGLRKRH